MPDEKTPIQTRLVRDINRIQITVQKTTTELETLEKFLKKNPKSALVHELESTRRKLDRQTENLKNKEASLVEITK